MRSMIIFALVLVVFSAISEAAIAHKRELTLDAPIEAKTDSKEKGDKAIASEDSKKEDKQSSKEDKSKEHEGKEDGREGTEKGDADDDMPDVEFVAIVAIFTDPETHQPRLIAHEVPQSMAGKKMF